MCAVRLSHLQDDAASEASHGSYKYRGYAANAFHPGRYYRANAAQGPAVNASRRWPGTFGNTPRNPAGLLGGPTEAVPLKPKVVSIVRNGQRPRANVKLLLNRRSVQSFEQLMSDISEAFGPKWKNNRVLKLYTTHGKEVRGVADFFREDDCFIAVGNERLTEHDVADMIEELYPDSAYAKMLLKDWEKQRRRDRKANKDIEPDKKDSGFVDGDQDNEALSTHRSQRQTHRSKRAAAAASERDSLMGSESSSPQGYYMLSKLERERKNAANEERDKARRRQNRLADQERRALDEERKRRGLAPLNHLKPLDDIRRKDPKEKEEARKRKEEEARKKIEEEKEAEKAKKAKEEREQAEKAARERMAAAEKAEKEKQEKEKQEREKAEKERKVEAEKEEKDSSEKERKAKAEKVAEKQEASAEKQEGGEKPDVAVTETEDKEKDKDNKEKPEKKRKRDKDNPSDKNTGRKAKAKVVRRSKAERQVSSDSFVTERYDLGRTLGDGNFAVVKISRQKSSGQEFAMKVIDKPKLKGKEHMVENEIDIMKDCNHPNIVKLYEEYETRDKIYLVMELVKVSAAWSCLSS